ncbi:MAG TPA: Asd/ArgC dimerization domain-containing protein [Acidobacteriaceae bacterium]|jgi:aspartate-semialdehyde dehydrogenase|nr:Asd/ArgC dimerization domain-containing protein [Acidobacteriaceae bacterium]
MAKISRGMIVGASTLLGKELAEELSGAQPAWELSLAGAGEESGQLVAAGDEAAVIQPLEPGVFAGQDVAFFAENAATTRAHWLEARRANAGVVDLTAVLEGEAGAAVRAPWVSGGAAPDMTTAIVVPAHPAAVMLGVVGSRLRAAFGPVRLAATVLEPASQQGSRGLAEMHRQTVSLLGFHALPQEVYDAQVAFNLRVSVGSAAKLDMGKIVAAIRRHLTAIAGEEISASTAMQLVQAPVFNGYTMSVYVELPEKAAAAAVREALQGGVVDVVDRGDESPNNQIASGNEGIQLMLREETAHANASRGYWLWMAADNLKLAARNAVACAAEMAALRPVGDAQ